MTNHYPDYQNADVFLVCGGNPAENHPMAQRWIGKAMARGAKLIVVDPRFTKTASQAHLYAPIRPGTDIAFLLGMSNYIIQNNLIQHEYVLNYTNASYLIHPDFKLPGDNEGVFSGFAYSDGDATAKYDTTTWTYQMEGDNIKKDPTLQHPNCVYQLLKKHVSRYDARTVSRITGMTEEQFLNVAKLYSSTGQPGKAGNYIYALGITQHSVGVQNVRAIAIMQLLLGNVGIAGGGVSAQRGESNVQGSTDQAMLYHYLPGYNPVPNAALHKDWAMYKAKETPASGYWSNRPKFIVSQQKAWFGHHATAENDWLFDWLPKTTGREHSHMAHFSDMAKGIIKGYICMGQNPIVGGISTIQAGEAMENLDWLVVMDPFVHETARFWERPGADPSKIETEVFFLPAAHLYEKPGTITNGNRWIQWRWKAIEPLGDSKNDLWILNELYKAIQDEYATDGVFPDPIRKLVWNYDRGGHEPSYEDVALEMNGYTVADGKGVPGFSALKDDGSTACGIWIYSGYFSNYENPACQSRIKETEGIGSNLGWAFSWPANRRILYNRASCDPSGRPWNPDLPVVAWDGSKWLTNDTPDFAAVDPETGQPNPPEKTLKPFIMQTEGMGRLFAIAPSLKDGPMPEHYEPVESPVKNIMSPTASNPFAQRYPGVFSLVAKSEDPEFPIVLSTHRVQEHYQSGASTRCMPNLVELKPEVYVEMSRELAERLGLKGGDFCIVSSARGEIKVRTYVTPCLKPFNIDGKEVDVVMIPYNWGFAGLATGASANDLTPAIGDPNSLIPEYKAFLCNIRKA